MWCQIDLFEGCKKVDQLNIKFSFLFVARFLWRVFGCLETIFHLYCKKLPLEAEDAFFLGKIPGCQA